MRRFISALFVCTVLCAVSFASGRDGCEIPLYGNAYYDKVNGSNSAFSNGRAKDKRLCLNMQNGLNATAYVYFYAGEVPQLSVLGQGKGELEVSFDGQTVTTVRVNSAKQKMYKIGGYSCKTDGYVAIRFSLRSDKDEVYLSSICVSGTHREPVYLREDCVTYFGLRGPSCHLNYGGGRKGDDIDWATISVTVPEEYDKEGSYYMALGFSCGYFGIQNNGKGVRNVLFSVWNAEDSDDPKAVARENRVEVMAHGEGVTARDFGHEGSGKQSFINAGWQPGHTYKFLLHAVRVDSTKVDYSAWFYDSVKDAWIYLSTLRRPHTKHLLTGLHSFLENFDPCQGNKTRKAYYHDGWIHHSNGEWSPIKRAFLTCDGTGNVGRRLDFNGGVEQNRFFLTNGGYFDRPEEIVRILGVGDDAASEPPAIDLNQFNH